MPAHVEYKTERIAYVRLVPEEAIPADRSSIDYILVPAQLLTLVFRGEEGWEVFAVGGASNAEWIPFERGELHRDVRSFLHNSEGEPSKGRQTRR